MNDPSSPPPAAPGAPPPAPPPPAEEAWGEIADWLREGDPARAFPDGFSGRRRARTLWFMVHPVFAFLARHHRATAFAGAALVLALVALVLFALRAREETLLPPVAVSFADPDAPAEVPPLEPEDAPLDLPDLPPEGFRP